MRFERIKTPGLAHLSYFLCSEKEAIIVDPRRDIDVYIELAHEQGVEIKYVLETHRQEDFVLGSKVLQEKTGAKIIGGRHNLFSHCDIQLEDGEYFKADEFTFLSLSTPGHTPESHCYGLYLKNQDTCWGIFTGDTLFIGETGRTDLPDINKTGENAKILYQSVNNKILGLGDQALIFPAHGSGSVCGGAIADHDQSTLGYERSSNPVFLESETEFVKRKINERIPRPPYFDLMEKMNLDGGWRMEQDLAHIKALSPEEFKTRSKDSIVIDTRSPESFASGHIEGSYNIWLDGLAVFGGWVCKRDTPVYLVNERNEDVNQALLMLSRLGVGRIKGFLAEGINKWRNQGHALQSSGVLTAQELHSNPAHFDVFDVREVTEYEQGHIQNAKHCYVGHLVHYLKSHKPSSKPIATICSVGHRGGMAASIFLRLGYKNVYNVLGGMKSWEALGYQTMEGTKKEKQGPPKKSIDNAAQWGSTH
ncbi:MAG: MBL fold metallo-hydrolase [Bacteriovoracaceae bacterium]|nr:MBL fold metallo-hydrolase [Bacteriovoracaceae bacterium]